jgi:Vacuolar protein sorting-associated protein 26
MARNSRMMVSKLNSLVALVSRFTRNFREEITWNLSTLLIPVSTELFYDRGSHYEFLSLSQELAAPGEMRQAQTFDFHFKNVEKQFESYQGINVKLRYVFLPFRMARYQYSSVLLGTSFESQYHGDWRTS